MHWFAETLAAAVVAAFLAATPLQAQNNEYVVYSSHVTKGVSRVEYCSIARGNMAIRGKVMDRKKTRQLVCEMLVKRLRMGVAYPDSPGSCQGYSVAAANECLIDGVDLKKIMTR